MIDGSGYIFRAFYALPLLTTHTGIPTNAVLGFVNMFMRLRSKIACDYCLVLFDAKRKNFRNDIFEAYKANRADPPAELVPQFAIIREAVDALNLTFLEMEGYEADDLIATYAKKALDTGMQAVIVSADKDLMQLIRDGVTYYDGMKDKFFTPADVKEKFGVLPDKVVDVQALSGDSTDNVPGVPGIGPKTAAELVNTFGSLENVLSHAAEIKQNKRREVLMANIRNAEISKQLVTLKDDVPVTLLLDDCACRIPSKQKLMDFINKYELNSLKARADKWADEQCAGASCQSKPTPEVKKEYTLIQDEATLERVVSDIQKARLFAIDTETTGLNPFKDKIVGLSLCAEAGKAFYLPLNHGKKVQGNDLFDISFERPTQLSLPTVSKHLKPLFEDDAILKIGHNIKFDMHFLQQIVGPDCQITPYDDTAVMSYCLDSLEHGHSLDELADIFLHYQTIKYEDVCGEGKNKISFEQVDLDKALDYAAEDADITLRLYQVLAPRLIKEKKAALYQNFDRPLVAVLQKMEKAGILLDSVTLKELDNDFSDQMHLLETEIYALAGEEFNVASPKQIGDILFVKMGLKGKKT
ncbi:MAG: DNA polymerase I, partial [Alphaproteobacteria bacterium]|nr:DNA polymerase I [Alphaproteobacteria bacterium]